MKLPSHPGATQPSKLEGLLGSPLFNVGMGLLSSNRLGGNPAQSVMSGLQNAQTFGAGYGDADRQAVLRKRLAELIAQRNGNGSVNGVPQTPAQQQINALPPTGSPNGGGPLPGLGGAVGAPNGATAPTSYTDQLLQQMMWQQLLDKQDMGRY